MKKEFVFFATVILPAILSVLIGINDGLRAAMLFFLGYITGGLLGLVFYIFKRHKNKDTKA